MVQRPSTPPFQGGDRGFESHQGRHALPRQRRGHAVLFRAAPEALIAGILLSAAGLVVAGETTATSAPFVPLRGPAEIRDGQLLAQPRLTLPALSAWTLTSGRWELQSALLWSNSFSWTQDTPGETPAERAFLVDGETAILDLTLRRGLAHNLDAAVRLPVFGRGGGALDGFIDAWHRMTNAPDGHRPDFLRSAFRAEGRTTDGGTFAWNDGPGWGLGNVEVEARLRLAGGGADGPSAALVARVLFPTGTGPYAGGGFGAGSQVVVDAPLGRRFGVFGGMGVTAQDATPVRGVEYEPVRFHAFAAVEWRVARPLSAVVETNVATRLVANVDQYPGTHWLVNIGGRLELGSRTRLDVFVTENIVSQQTTTDFAVHLGLSVRP